MATGDSPDWTGRGTTRYLGSITVTPAGIGSPVSASADLSMQSYDRGLVVAMPQIAFGGFQSVLVGVTGGGVVTKNQTFDYQRRLVLAYVNPAATSTWSVTITIDAPIGPAQTYYVFAVDSLPFVEVENGELPLDVNVIAYPAPPQPSINTTRTVVANVGVQATFTLPANPAGRWRLKAYSATLAGAVASSPYFVVLDGATLVWATQLAIPAVAGSRDRDSLSNVDIDGTLATAMTIGFNAGSAGDFQTVSATVELIPI